MIQIGDVSSIQPQTDVALLKGVQCELMEDTLYFSSASAQYNYFWGKRDTTLTWTQSTPVSVMNGVLNVKANADKVMECNYLMIRNQNFSQRWYYCIITKVDYLSPNSCQVRFTVDAVQTYFFDYKVENAFIIREHVSDDTIGAHTIPEGLETGEYMIDSIVTPETTWFSDFVIAIYSTYDGNIQPVDGAIRDNMYSGVAPQFFEATSDGVSSANKLLQALVEDNKSDSIVSILWIPKAFKDGVSELLSANRPAAINGYVPENNKLFTYPYVNCVLSNNNGVNQTLMFELSENRDKISLNYETAMSCNPSIICIPVNYRGYDYDIASKVIQTGFPMCAYAIDSYKAYQAMNGGTIATGVSQAQSVVGAAAGGASSGAAMGAALGSVIPGLGNAAGAAGGAILGGLAGALSSLGQVQGKMDMPLVAYGTSGGNAQYQVFDEYPEIATICAYVQTIRAEYARCIDDFFTMYGYKVNRQGIPSRHARTNFTYTQCSDIRIGGNVPQVYMEQIAARYKSGIRFWTNTANYQNYRVNNKPLGEGEDE